MYYINIVSSQNSVVFCILNSNSFTNEINTCYLTFTLHNYFFTLDMLRTAFPDPYIRFSMQTPTHHGYGMAHFLHFPTTISPQRYTFKRRQSTIPQKVPHIHSAGIIVVDGNLFKRQLVEPIYDLSGSLF